MKVQLNRFISNKDETIGVLLIDGVAQAVTCEDQKQAIKVMKETRIPEGTYKIALRKEGGHDASYAKMFPAIHKGMLELQNVPGFQYILIHIGNTDVDTDGCILVGEKFYIAPTGKLSIENSSLAYQKVYKAIIAEISAGREVSITIKNIEA
jgi:hypothetical protein